MDNAAPLTTRQKYRAATRAKTAQDRRARVVKKRAYVDEYKSKLGCAVCGEKDPIVLDLHHVDGVEKEACVSRLVINDYSLESINAELAKCQMLCANDHRRLHFSLQTEQPPANAAGGVR